MPSMSESERIALAARLHVALRRKHGRVTDTEWMATNAEYAAEIVRMTRAHAADTKDEELYQLATRLEQAMEPLDDAVDHVRGPVEHGIGLLDHLGALQQPHRIKPLGCG